MVAETGWRRARGRALWSVAVAVAWALVATACGSTAPDGVGGDPQGPGGVAVDEFGEDPRDDPAGGEGPGGEGGVAGAGAADTPGGGGGLGLDRPAPAEPAPAGRPEGEGAGVAPGGGAEGAEAAPGAGGGRAGGRVPAGSGVRGVTDDTVQIGMFNVDRDQTQAVQRGLVGGGDSEQGTREDRDAGDAIAAYINEHGGVAGRRLEIVWHDSDIPSLVTAEGRRRDAQRACATWTEDNEVFAFMATTFVDDVYLDCARANDAVVIASSGFGVDEQLFGSMGHLWYSMTRMITDRRDRNLVDNLVRRGVLTADSKVGIVVEDWEGTRRGVTNGMEPALAAHGIEVVEKAVFPDAIQSPWDTYVLRFRSAGVTHVLFAQTWDGANGFPLLFMMLAAENQAWRPIWGIGSDNRPVGVALSGAPRPQMANAFGMGWQPRWDVGSYEETEARERCAGIAGRPLTRSGDEAWHVFCDLLFFLRAALNAAPELSPAGMSAAMDALGGRFAAIDTIGGRTGFRSDRHDGVAVQRDLVHNEDCGADGTNCWRYVGDPRPMP